MDSVKAVRYQATEVCDALEELAECTDDAQGKSEAESLVSQMRSYKFLVALVFWHSLLFRVNFVSKELQSDTMDIVTGLTSFESRRDGVVVRASASQSVDLGFIPLVESYQKTLKNGIYNFPAWRSAFMEGCGEQAGKFTCCVLGQDT